MIVGTKLEKSFTTGSVFTDISFKLGNGKKIGLVGTNGCGKTTLFKIIVGLEEADHGNLQTNQELIGYIPQEFNFPNISVGAYLKKSLDHDWETYRIDELVNKLSFNNYNPRQKISSLSEGQQMKIKMIEVLLTEPTTLLIDEPTNHLDIEGIQWFENYIKKLNITVALISHDRQFLNNVVDEIWEIEKQGMLKFVGNYDDYQQGKLNLIEKQGKEYKLFIKKKASLERLLANARKKSDGKSRGKAIRSAKKRIVRETKGENEKHEYSKETIANLNFQTNITHLKVMLKLDSVSMSYGKTDVFKNLSFSIFGGEKAWLFGPNGAGKTTIVKMILGKEEATTGEVQLGERMKIGYFAQKQTHLNYESSLLEHYLDETHCPYDKAFGNLKKFLFQNDELKKKVKNLSPGQRARFAFAIFAYNNYDFLILDEPTNHLDIETKEVIEQSLSDFKGTLLLVSHDRYFVEKVGITKPINIIVS
ncbi:MAG: ribosomal protection-like ABC-F family protein [Candidatus Beckwithbacteria bacterium]|nr:ATP-binding cassette domain-containing protein [Patescibacteria group bacterium]